MQKTHRYARLGLIAGLLVACLPNGQAGLLAEEAATDVPPADAAWQEQAVEYAQIMSHVPWTPVADGMPMQWRGSFQKGAQYTGVPYSNQTYQGRTIGRSIGFEIFLKTFLAAVENPESVLYTEKVPVSEDAAKAYYGMVCSSFTSYALQCGMQYVARQQAPHYGEGIGPQRQGVVRVEPQSAQAAAVGDVIYTPPGGQHVEIVTEITRDEEGRVTHVRVEDSAPPTTRNRNRSAANFESHISARGRGLYRITDLDAWREGNRAESFRFPNYAEDAAQPVINRVLLLDHGDWVPYFREQPVKINVMDRDGGGAKRLIVQRGDTVVEEMELDGPGVIERSFSTCGDYTAHCVMSDGSSSPACEFAVCDLSFELSVSEVTPHEPWEITLASCNLQVIYVYLSSAANPYGRYHVLLSDHDREQGQVTVPAGLLQAEDAGVVRVRLFGENRYGRLQRQKTITVVNREP